MSIRCFTALTILLLALPTSDSPAADAGKPAEIVETHPLYADGPAPNCRFRPWSMIGQQRPAAAGAPGHIWLNGDWQARPWAGIGFLIQKTGQPWKVTADWLANGYVRFLFNGGLDRSGSPNGEVPLQVRPECKDIGFEHLPSRLIDRGRGLDEDPQTWQEVLIPLRLWTKLKSGDEISGLSIQSRGQVQRSFGLADVGFVRYDRRPEWIAQAENLDVAQPWVEWPARDALPEPLRADRHPPQVRQGRFVGPDGRRVFVLNPYLSEDPRLDILGSTTEGRVAPSQGLYDPQRHGWIYQELPSQESLCRLGFNSISTFVAPQPFWESVGYSDDRATRDASFLPGTVKRVGLPFYVDMVCFPWTIGAPASAPEKTKLPGEAFTAGPNHWTPYRIIGPGRDTWLKAWRASAQHYREAGAKVLMFELFNEPAYTDLSAAHLREFRTWLERRHGTLDRLNRAWQSKLASWDEAVGAKDLKQFKTIAGRALDFDDYLSERFTDLVAAGVREVSSRLPGTLVGVQPMGGYAMQPREAVWKHRLTAVETVVLTPTGGGRWSPGAVARQSASTVTASPMAGAPLEDDLLLALAGDKMLYDNETYLRGQTAVDTRNRLWEHVAVGLDGLTVFSWSRRGWIWWKDRDALVTEADKYPYASLIPLARRTEALRGILDFAKEIQPLAERILPKPWGPAPCIGILYSWPQARHWAIDPAARNKTTAYHAALRYSHWNAALVPSDRVADGSGLKELDVLVVPGVAKVEPELPQRLEEFVRKGGTLILGEEVPGEDLYGQPLDTAKRLGVTLGRWLGPQQSKIILPAHPLSDAISGTIDRMTDLRSVSAVQGRVVVSDAKRRPLAVCRSLENGHIYASGADLAGYPLARLLAVILEDAAVARGQPAVPPAWRAAEVRDAKGTLVPNVLVSRRSYPTHHALVILNRDEYKKTIRVAIPGLDGKWKAEEALTHTALPARGTAYELTVEPNAPAVVLFEPVAGP